MDNPFFTVFTPLYNRANLLRRVFDSLESQTFKEFEWLIIDDGSVDFPESIIKGFQLISSFKIIYVKKSNGGKHSTFAFAFELANGSFIVNLDSDDTLISDGLEKLHTAWLNLDDKDKFIGVTGLCMDQYGKLVGDKFPHDKFISNSLDSFYKYNIKGEKFGMQRLSILKNFSFPEVSSSGYIGEGYLWDRIALSYNTLYINDFIRVYYIEEKPSIMTTLNSLHNLPSVRIYMLDRINSFNHYFKYKPIRFIYYNYKYVLTSYQLGHSSSFIISQINSRKFVFFTYLLIPIVRFISRFNAK